jgi:hypothetical protein
MLESAAVETVDRGAGQISPDVDPYEVCSRGEETKRGD